MAQPHEPIVVTLVSLARAVERLGYGGDVASFGANCQAVARFADEAGVLIDAQDAAWCGLFAVEQAERQRWWVPEAWVNEQDTQP